MKNRIRWSVIIPTAGRAAILKRALVSLCRQTLPPAIYEILVVNNGKDDTASDAIVRETMRLFPAHQVRLLKAAPPGLLSGRHLGAQEAQAPVLTFVDDDIIVSETYGASILKAFANPDIHIAGGPCLPEYETPPPDWLDAFWTYEQGRNMCAWLSLIDQGDKPRLVSPNYVWGLNFSIRKQTLFDLGGFHPDNVPAEYQMYQGDGETGLTEKAIKNGIQAYYDPNVKVVHVVPASRLTEAYFRNRAFYQGVCHSYAATRKSHGSAPAPLLPLRADPVAPEDLQKRVHNAHVDGWYFHQNAIGTSPKLLEWTLKKDYWNYAYPQLEKNLDFPREWCERILKNPMEALGNSAMVLRLALGYAEKGRFGDAIRAVVSVERVYPRLAEAKTVRALLLESMGKHDDAQLATNEALKLVNGSL